MVRIGRHVEIISFLGLVMVHVQLIFVLRALQELIRMMWVGTFPVIPNVLICQACENYEQLE